MKGRMLKEYYEQTPVINNQSPAYRDFYEWYQGLFGNQAPIGQFPGYEIVYELTAALQKSGESWRA